MGSQSAVDQLVKRAEEGCFGGQCAQKNIEMMGNHPSIMPMGWCIELKVGLKKNRRDPTVWGVFGLKKVPEQEGGRDGIGPLGVQDGVKAGGEVTAGAEDAVPEGRGDVDPEADRPVLLRGVRRGRARGGGGERGGKDPKGTRLFREVFGFPIKPWGGGL